MRAWKIAGLAALIVWMAWVSLTLIEVKSIALEACGLAAVHGENANGGILLPVTCPDLDDNEVKAGKPRTPTGPGSR